MPHFSSLKSHKTFPKPKEAGREPGTWPINYWCQICTCFNLRRNRSKGKVIKTLSVSPLLIYLLQQSQMISFAKLPLYCPALCEQLAATAPLLQITFVVLAPMEELWGPSNLPQLGKKPAPTREREVRGATTWQSSQSPRQMPARFCKIIHLVLRKLYTLKKEINPGHHCLNLKHPCWQSFHIYSLASEISLLPFSHSGYLASQPFILFTLPVHVNASYPDKHSNIRLLIKILKVNYTESSFSLLKWLAKSAKPVKDRASHFSVVLSLHKDFIIKLKMPSFCEILTAHILTFKAT